MKIKQVEELVGITSKNIRFYEDQGLINPDRADNGYREYHMEDVEALKKIKLLRKLGVSLESISKIFNGHMELVDCLGEHLLVLEQEQESVKRRQMLTNDMIEANTGIDSIDCDLWLDKMEEIEKEGVDFVDVNKIDIHMKKKAGALAGGLFVIIYMIVIASILVWAKLYDPSMPTAVVILVITAVLVISAAIGYAIVSRMKEIDGGEEDEALKY